MSAKLFFVLYNNIWISFSINFIQYYIRINGMLKKHNLYSWQIIVIIFLLWILNYPIQMHQRDLGDQKRCTLMYWNNQKISRLVKRAH